MKNENYIQIQGWMINELMLSGNELICYAIIYGFSQDGDTKFNGSSSYLSKCMNCSKPTVFKTLKSLIDKGFIIKTDVYTNNVKFCQYSTSFTSSKETLSGVVKKLNTGSKETLSGGSKETLYNNTINNKYINNTNDIEGKTNRFRPPTIKEIDNYILEKTGFNNLEESENFYNYYESKGWMVGKVKMKKWKNALSRWLKRSKQYKKEKQQNDGSNLEDIYREMLK